MLAACTTKTTVHSSVQRLPMQCTAVQLLHIH